MKKLLAVLLAVGMVLSFAACGTNDAAEDATETPDTMAYALLADFEERCADEDDLTVLAQALLENEVIPFAGVTMPVEEGLLTGFANAEITGFEEGVMFSPMIGTIPFVGYLFDLADEADAEAFTANLEANANLSWNICTSADEMVTGNVGDKVFFVMSPLSIEE